MPIQNRGERGGDQGGGYVNFLLKKFHHDSIYILFPFNLIQFFSTFSTRSYQTFLTLAILLFFYRGRTGSELVS